MLSVARLGAGITDDFANHNDLARDLLLSAAQRSIFIAQQDIGFTLGRTDPLWPESTLERLADFLLQDKGDVFMVLSNANARAPTGESYSNGVALESVARKIRDVAVARGQGRDEASVSELPCRRLHIAPRRFGPDASWPENLDFANHSKFFMVDERALYVGSDNVYPVNLQEFGYIVDLPSYTGFVMPSLEPVHGTRRAYRERANLLSPRFHAPDARVRREDTAMTTESRVPI